MVAHLSGTDLAVAGHAVALAGWHQVSSICTVPFLWSCTPRFGVHHVRQHTCRPMAFVAAAGRPQCQLKREQSDAAPKTSPTGCIPEQTQWYSCFLDTMVALNL